MTDPDPFSSGDQAGFLRRFRGDLLARVPAVLRAPVRTSPGLDEGLRRNIAEDTFERRRVSTALHLALVLVVGGLFWGEVPSKPLVVWLAPLTAVILIRIGLHRGPAAPLGSRRDIALRLATCVTAALWGVGPLVMLPHVDLFQLMLLMVLLAGTVAAGTTTMADDPTLFYPFLTAMLGPLALALLLHGTSRAHVGAAVLIAIYAGSTILLYETNHRQLIARFRAQRDAEQSVELVARERAFLRALLESSATAIATLEPSGTVLAVNPAFEALFGYAADEVVGHRLRELIVPHDGKSEPLSLEEVVRGSRSVVTEAERRRKDGSLRTVRISAAQAGGAGHGAVFALYDDVTAIRKAERELHAAEARYRQAVESASDLVWQADSEGRLTFVNHMSQEFFGQPPAAMLGTSGWSLVHPDSVAAAEAGWKEIERGRSVQDIELQVFDGRGGVRHISYSAQPILDQDGTHVVGVSGISRDVTERAEARRALEEARRSAERAAQAKGAFLANMSHEIRTPLNGILGMIELLLDGHLHPEQQRAAQLVRESGEALLGLINDILDFSKIEAGRLELEEIDFDLSALMDSVVRLLSVRAGQRGVELVCEVRPEVPQSVKSDPGRLRQILNNLVGNALKFTERGEVLVTVGADATDPAKPALQFEVIDTGIGIAPEKLAFIFEEFSQADAATTRKYGGTGLGLAITRRLVALMGGQLTVESEVGRGTVFRFNLPFRPAQGERRPVAIHDARFRGLRALVVDDNATNRRIMRDMLRPTGIDIREAESAETGFRILRQEARSDRRFDLVLLDAQMPDQDGFELAERIRGDTDLRDTRLLLLTSAGQPGDGQRCRQLGIAGYFPKPVSRAELLEAVAAVTRGPVQAAEGLVTRHSMEENRPKLRILLAEDNPVNQQVAATMLRRRGHHVDVVENGRRAVEAAKSAPYDVVLMDVQMPELDGLAATCEIRRDRCLAGLPIVAVTAHAMQEERERCVATGMNGYLTKPFKPHELFAAAEGWALPAGDSGAETATARAPVDLAAFRQAMLDAGVEEAVGAMLEVYLRDAPGRMAALEAAVARGAMADAAAAAHAFRSASATIAANRLAELLREAEQAGRDGDSKRLRELLPHIREQHDATVSYLAPTSGGGVIHAH